MPPFELEVCVDNFDKALIAQTSGASRIELCTDLSSGGVTPPETLIRQCVEALSIPTHVLVRPRAGNFVYNESEIAEMLHSIALCQEIGVAGVVWGALTSQNDYDRPTCTRLMEASRGLSVTFHKAFDEVNDPQAVISILVEDGFDRILTSGAQATAIEGKEALREYILWAQNKIVIMCAGGIRSSNIGSIAQVTHARSWHAAFGKEGVETPEKRVAMQQDIRSTREQLAQLFGTL